MPTQSYSTCSICGETFPLSYHCTTCHKDVCHSCAQLSCSQQLGYYDHEPPALTLTPREVAALTQYQQHVQRTVGVEWLVRLVTEEETP